MKSSQLGWTNKSVHCDVGLQVGSQTGASFGFCLGIGEEHEEGLTATVSTQAGASTSTGPNQSNIEIFFGTSIFLHFALFELFATLSDLPAFRTFCCSRFSAVRTFRACLRFDFSASTVVFSVVFGICFLTFRILLHFELFSIFPVLQCFRLFVFCDFQLCIQKTKAIQSSDLASSLLGQVRGQGPGTAPAAVVPGVDKG